MQQKVCFSDFPTFSNCDKNYSARHLYNNRYDIIKVKNLLIIEIPCFKVHIFWEGHKILQISTVDLSYVVPVKSTANNLLNFMAFSDYVNFIKPMTLFLKSTWKVSFITEELIFGVYLCPKGGLISKKLRQITTLSIFSFGR